MPPQQQSIPQQQRHHHQTYYPTSSKSASFKGCCCCLFLLFSFLALLAVAVVLVIILAVKPKKPQFDLQQVGVQYMGITPTASSLDPTNTVSSQSASLSLTIHMLFTAVNPNKVGIKYGESHFTVMYGGIPLGKATVPGFYQEAHSSRNVEATINVDRANLMQADAASLIRDASLNDRVELRVLGDVGAKIRVLNFDSPGVQGALAAMKRKRETRAAKDEMRKLEFDLEVANDDLARFTSGKIEGQEAQIAEANAARQAAEDALKKMEDDHAMLKDELLKVKEDLRRSEQQAALDEQRASAAEEKIEVLHSQIDAALARAETAEKQAEEANKRAGEMGAAAKSAKEAVAKRAEEVTAADNRAKEAEHRAEVLRQQVGETIQRAEAAEQQVEDMKKEAEVVNRLADNAFEELTAFREQAAQELEMRVADARDEAEERTGRDFLYTLWMSHPDMDFSIFGDIGLETIEDFKSKAASSAPGPEPSANPDPPAEN